MAKPGALQREQQLHSVFALVQVNQIRSGSSVSKIHHHIFQGEYLKSL